MKLHILVAVAAATAIAVPAAAATRPSQLIVFGDSLVDAGNARIRFGPTVAAPSLGYFEGRFTNGPDFTDLLSRKLYGGFTTPSLAGGTNYSYGGARAVSNADYATGGDTVPDLLAQLAAYDADSGGIADPDALYVINFGGNDVFAVLSGTTGGVDATTYLTNVATTIAGSVASLQAAGATRFLVTGIPNPIMVGFDGQVLLTAALDAVPLDGDTSLLRFDYQNFFIALAANPGAFGVAPFTEAGNCIGNRPVVNGRTDCTGYASFDGIHPTAQVQAAVYREVLGLTGLAGIPEPRTWALLIAGFGMVGMAMRRRASAMRRRASAMRRRARVAA